MEWIADPQAWVALGALTLLEIVLGIDNIVFISVLSNKLPKSQRALARRLGLGLALGGRVLLLFTISWVMALSEPLFSVLTQSVSGRDIILVIGGVFLIGKATFEIHEKLERDDETDDTGAMAASFAGVITQIVLLDMVFSVDSVLTAVGMADDVAVMIIAVTIAIGIMMLTAKSVSQFVEEHPTVKMLALSFLLLIGMTLVAEGGGHHIPKGYIYSAMGFALLVEMLNLRAEAVNEDEERTPVRLHQPRLRRAVQRVLEKSE
ncbi:MAG: TerC family protein [Salinibacter sp.]